MYLIETKRLQLRELKMDDLSALHQILGDRDNMRFYPDTYSETLVEAWIKRSITSYEENGFALWAVILKESQTFIGQCGISYQNIDGEKLPEIGYHINKKYWNKGFATEASVASMKYGFEKFHFPKLYIHTYVKNIPSQRIAEKIGMQKTKTYDKDIKQFEVVWPHIVYEMKREDHLNQ